MSCLPTSRGLFRTRARRNNISFFKTTRWKTSEKMFQISICFLGVTTKAKRNKKSKSDVQKITCFT